ncbi:MAG: bifunctional diaminohydroxyphosphoribosylaminopyrimidine deaminase/5-amino-6-(5-phosphoribosylamino)uracil reductase RibD [Exilibacterium sp.]
MMQKEIDIAMMARSLRLAERGLYTTSPNPRVGCVLVQAGQIIAEGWHVRAGEPHAEINAIAASNGKTPGATAYVTLEPCSYTGKTGPCCEALIRAGVTRVVFAMEDPNPKVAGRGIECLRQAGIDVTGPLLEEQARELNPGFIKRMETGRPLVRCKLAMSLDGRTGMASGESKWVTGPMARRDVQRLRARSCGIVTGIGSILHDDPALTVREEELGLEQAAAVARRQPLRVVVDSQLRTPPGAKLLQGGGTVLIATVEPEEANGADEPIPSASARVAELRAKGAEVATMGAYGGQVALGALLVELARRECNEILVEAGADLAGAFLRAGLLDELIVYMAPKLMGSDARPLFTLPLQTMAAQLPLTITDIRAVGNDWRITARPDPEG